MEEIKKIVKSRDFKTLLGSLLLVSVIIKVVHAYLYYPFMSAIAFYVFKKSNLGEYVQTMQAGQSELMSQSIIGFNFIIGLVVSYLVIKFFTLKRLEKVNYLFIGVTFVIFQIFIFLVSLLVPTLLSEQGLNLDLFTVLFSGNNASGLLWMAAPILGVILGSLLALRSKLK